MFFDFRLTELNTVTELFQVLKEKPLYICCSKILAD